MQFYVVADVIVAIVVYPSLLGRSLRFPDVQEQRCRFGNVNREIETSAIACIRLIAK